MSKQKIHQLPLFTGTLVMFCTKLTADGLLASTQVPEPVSPNQNDQPTEPDTQLQKDSGLEGIIQHQSTIKPSAQTPSFFSSTQSSSDDIILGSEQSAQLVIAQALEQDSASDNDSPTNRQELELPDLQQLQQGAEAYTQQRSIDSNQDIDLPNLQQLQQEAEAYTQQRSTEGNQDIDLPNLQQLQQGAKTRTLQRTIDSNAARDAYEAANPEGKSTPLSDIPLKTASSQSIVSPRVLTPRPRPNKPSPVILSARPRWSGIDFSQVKSISCNENESATVFEVNQQDIQVISWESDVFEADYSSDTRCKQVSARFEAYRKLAIEGQELYLVPGKLNAQPVVCVSTQLEGECGDGVSKHEGLLFTLTHERAEQTKSVAETLSKGLETVSANQTSDILPIQE